MTDEKCNHTYGAASYPHCEGFSFIHTKEDLADEKCKQTHASIMKFKYCPHCGEQLRRLLNDPAPPIKTP